MLGAILGAIFASVGAFFWWLIRNTIESAQRSHEHFRENRLKVYMEALDPVLTALQQAKRGRSGRKKGLGFSEDQFRRALVNVKLMATDEVVKSLDDMITGSSDDRDYTDEESATRLVDQFGGLLLAIRKDLGNPTTTLTELDMLKVIIVDVEQYYLKPGRAPGKEK